MYTITKQIEIDAAHRVPLHESKCKNLHGHRYVVELAVSGQLIAEGSETGMVKDFSFLKQVLTEEVHDACDHALVMAVGDPMLPTLLAPNSLRDICDVLHPMSGDQSRVITFGIEGTRICVIRNVPTAENLAKHWGMRMSLKMPAGVEISAVTVWETPTSTAQWRP